MASPGRGTPREEAVPQNASRRPPELRRLEGEVRWRHGAVARALLAEHGADVAVGQQRHELGDARVLEQVRERIVGKVEDVVDGDRVAELAYQ